MENLETTPASQEQIQTTAFPPTTPPEPTLTPQDIARAVVNSPTLSPDEFALGDRTFKILDLDYDEYVVFVAYLQPLASNFLSKIRSTSIGLPEIELKAEGIQLSALTTYCMKDLPEMARIVCAKTDPTITIADVKKLAKNPIKCAEVVLKQIVRNGVIKDFTDFFAQIRPLLKK